MVYVFGFFYATESIGWIIWATLLGTVLAFLLTGHYFSRESTLALALTCFAIPALVVGTLRGALGKAPRP